MWSGLHTEVSIFHCIGFSVWQLMGVDQGFANRLLVEKFSAMENVPVALVWMVTVQWQVEVLVFEQL